MLENLTVLEIAKICARLKIESCVWIFQNWLILLRQKTRETHTKVGNQKVIHECKASDVNSLPTASSLC